MTKQAKSRLSASQLKKLKTKPNTYQSNFGQPKVQQEASLWQKYLHLLPTLLVGCIFLAVLILIFLFVRPSQIANWGLYQSYFPLHFVVFGTVFFIGTFLFQKTRRGLWLAIFIVSLLFLKLQQVVITPVEILIIVGTLLMFEAVAKLVLKR